jgi:hypothetical protein
MSPSRPLSQASEPLVQPTQNPDSQLQGLNAAPGDDIVLSPRLTRSRQDSLENPPSEPVTLRETEARLNIAIHRYERNAATFRQGVIPKQQFDASLDEIRLLVGRLRGYDDALMDEQERLSVERMKKQAEIKVAEAQHEVSSVIVARNKRLNERKPGMVSEDDVVKAKSEASMASAQIEVKQVDLQEVELKIQHLRKRRELIRRDLERVATAIPEIAKEFEMSPIPQTSPAREVR